MERITWTGLTIAVGQGQPIALKRGGNQRTIYGNNIWLSMVRTTVEDNASYAKPTPNPAVTGMDTDILISTGELVTA